MSNKQAQELLIQNGQLVADTLRHLADNEIDSDYFAITSTSENGTETECELVITEYARQAAGTVDELVKALEAADALNKHLDLAIRKAEGCSEALRRKLEVAEELVAELEAREVALPPRYSMLHRDGFDEPYHTVFVYKQHQVIEVLQAAGIRINGEG